MLVLEFGTSTNTDSILSVITSKTGDGGTNKGRNRLIALFISDKLQHGQVINNGLYMLVDISI
jgi:hypothetical protein